MSSTAATESRGKEPILSNLNRISGVDKRDRSRVHTSDGTGQQHQIYDRSQRRPPTRLCSPNSSMLHSYGR